MELDDNTFLARFEQRTLGAEHFDHQGHLRIGWIHLRRYGLEVAVARVCDGIRELASHFGAPEKFNHTLTEAILRIMAQRMASATHQGFSGFLAANADLVTDARALLARYYSDEVLQSGPARRGWMEPDRAPLE